MLKTRYSLQLEVTPDLTVKAEQQPSLAKQLQQALAAVPRRRFASPRLSLRQLAIWAFHLLFHLPVPLHPRQLLQRGCAQSRPPDHRQSAQAPPRASPQAAGLQ